VRIQTDLKVNSASFPIIEPVLNVNHISMSVELNKQASLENGPKAGSISVVGLISNTAEDILWDKVKLRANSPGTQSLEIRVASVLQLPKKISVIPEIMLLDWVMQPFNYQIEGIRMLLSSDALLLADDMGLGKTFQVIAALRIMFYKKQIEEVLILVPANLIAQWRRDFRTIAPELILNTIHGTAEERNMRWHAKAQVYITSYEILRSDMNGSLFPIRKYWDVVVIDEAQKIKNRDSEISQKCKMLPRKRAWSLTGTPLENSTDELASILEFTRPNASSEKLFSIYPGLRMREIQHTIQLRRKKADVLKDLPPKTIITVPVTLLSNQRKSYDMAEKEGIFRLKNEGESIRIEHVLQLILRLKQICNFCPVSGESAKMDDIQNRIQILAEEGHKALIFSQFIDSRFGVAAIAQRLKPYKAKSYTGSLDSMEKEGVIKAFKEDPRCKVLVLSLRAGGQGLNLQEASYVFHFDRWWNPAVELQAEDRSHRIGQNMPVTIYKYTCENTIEERIENILTTKRQIFKDIVDDVSMPITSKMSESEIFGLFGLTPPKK
jgi:SNF2 family DNA or RNA helicase